MAVLNWQLSYTSDLQIQQLVIKLLTVIDYARLTILYIVNALEDLNYNKQEWYLVVIKL